MSQAVLVYITHTYCHTAYDINSFCLQWNEISESNYAELVIPIVIHHPKADLFLMND